MTGMRTQHWSMNLTRLLILPCLLLLGGLTARAQVAAPDLTAGTVRFGVMEMVGVNGASWALDNPAVLYWSRTNPMGVGQLNGLYTDNDTAYTKPIPYSGEYAGFRAVGDEVAMAVAHLSVKSDFSGNPKSFRDSKFQLGFKVADFLAFGVNQGVTRFEDVTMKRKLNQQVLGISMKLWDYLYLGYAAGVDEVQLDNKSTLAFTSLLLERTTTRYGGALSGENFHLEYFKSELKPFEHLDLPLDLSMGLIAETVQFQFNAWNLLFGYTDTEVKFFTTALLSPNNAKSKSFDFGWVMDSGLSLTMRATFTRRDWVNPIGPIAITEAHVNRTMELNWLF